jgi:hypothetical protein
VTPARAGADGTAVDRSAARGTAVDRSTTGGTADDRTPDGPGAGGIATGEPGADAAHAGRLAGAAPATRRPATALVVGGLTTVVVVPLLVALGALHSPRWHPVLDLAMTELRVRDVGTGDSPLVGLVGRLSTVEGRQGSHPGPLSFWALAPVYRLLGSSSWSLLAGVVVLNATAIGLTIWLAVRRGGALLGLAFAAALAVLAHLYGTQVLTEPWNPYLPVMWWALTLVAVWSVVCDDLPVLPVAVVAGSFCLQTHISYLGLVGALAGLGLVALVVGVRRLRDDRPGRRRLLRWSAAGAALGIVLWLPPIIDQLTTDPGNAWIVLDNFRHPEDDALGPARGVELLVVQLNPWRYLAGDLGITGSVLPGLAVLACWLVAAVAARRLPADGPHRRPLVRLHAVVAVALVLGLVSASRILGYLWHYLTLWAWGITMLLLIAVGWTVVAVAAGRGWARPGVALRAGAGALAVVLLGWTGMFVADAIDAEPTDARDSVVVAEAGDAVAAAIDGGEVPGGGPDGRYLVTWTDGFSLGGPGFGLLAELERRGYEVGAYESHRSAVVDHRVMPVEEATAEVHFSRGPDIAVWDEVAGAERVATVDPRTDQERAAYERAREAAVREIREAGHEDLVPMVDEAPFALRLYFDEVPPRARQALARMLEIGQPAAVFVGPVTLSP